MAMCTVTKNLRHFLTKDVTGVRKTSSVFSQKSLLSSFSHQNHCQIHTICSLNWHNTSTNNNIKHNQKSYWQQNNIPRHFATVAKAQKNTSTQTNEQHKLGVQNSQDEEEQDEEVNDNDEDEEDDDDEEEDEGDYESGGEYDSDEEFTNSLTYDVRDDVYWNELPKYRQKQYLYCQRHKNSEMWDNGIIPRAVTTSHFNYRTIKAVKRFPNLGKYSQKSSHMINGPIKTLAMNNINTIENINNGFYFNQPKYKPLTQMLNKRERKLYKNENVDYSVKAGDTIKLELYTNLVKKKSQTIREALVLMVRKPFENGASIMIRNAERDGLVIMRQYPLYSPWIKSLSIIEKPSIRLRKRLYFMYDAPADVTDHVEYGRSIGVRTRKEFFYWLKNTKEGIEYGRDKRLLRRINFIGMRQRQGWAKKLADLYAGTAIAKNVKGPMRAARREMKYRLRANPTPRGLIRRHKKTGHKNYKLNKTS